MTDRGFTLSQVAVLYGGVSRQVIMERRPLREFRGLLDGFIDLQGPNLSGFVESLDLVREPRLLLDEIGALQLEVINPPAQDLEQAPPNAQQLVFLLFEILPPPIECEFLFHRT